MCICTQHMKHTETQLTIQFSGYVGSSAAHGRNSMHAPVANTQNMYVHVCYGEVELVCI